MLKLESHEIEEDENYQDSMSSNPIETENIVITEVEDEKEDSDMDD